MTGKLSYSLLCGLLGFAALAPQALYALSPQQSQALEDQLAMDMEVLVDEVVADYFRSHGLPVPVADTRTEASFVEAGGAVRAAELRLHVSITTDQPAPVVREARQTLARVLVDRGYRFGTLEGVKDPRPLVTLTLEAIEPPPGAMNGNAWQEYATFAAILLALGASLILLGALIVAPWRGRRRKAHARGLARAPGRSSPAAWELPEIPVHLDAVTMQVTTAAAPTVLEADAPAALQLSESNAEFEGLGEDVYGDSEATLDDDTTVAVARERQGAARDDETAAADEYLSYGDEEAEVDGILLPVLPLDPETEALRQMPFDKVLDRLVAAAPGERRQLLARLDLNPLLRRRLEKELLA